jgi:lysyl-tRNA synthetase class 2
VSDGARDVAPDDADRRGPSAGADAAADAGESLNHVLRARREKLAALEARGVPPFAYRYDRTHDTIEAVRAFEALEGEARALPTRRRRGAAGRGRGTRGARGRPPHVVALAGQDGVRAPGRRRGRVQCYFRRDVLGDEQFELLKTLVDIGDVVGRRGPAASARAPAR